VTVKGDADDTEEALNAEIALPPLTAEAVMVAAPFPKGRPVPTFAAETVGACGTDVTVIAEEAADAAEVPAALVAVTVKVTDAEDDNPPTPIGEDAPVAVCPVLAVTVKDVALGERAGKEKETLAAASLKALPVPMSVAVTPIGANGSKKSFDAWDFLPILLPDAIVNLLISY
jgi:hypothetical protein